MPDKPIRVILDTNLWISFLISNNYSKLDHIILSKKIRLLFSSHLIDEFLEVARRAKFRRFFPLKEIEKVLDILNVYADLIEVKSVETICRDEKDNFLLSLAIDGKADFLITGDEDLLILKKNKGTTIITITAFLSQHI